MYTKQQMCFISVNCTAISMVIHLSGILSPFHCCCNGRIPSVVLCSMCACVHHVGLVFVTCSVHMVGNYYKYIAVISHSFFGLEITA